ncbi:endonuclease ASCRUDRAFT_70970 [Ascoidea rubescens DSM 1968]|uniref:GIY-YIG domain-containing protein n=1 Tax=Ascoidea rubescens DSM 1968 TaxID=1344418 RepID=A0A1D2VG78_9ASCO|nr:hypothetical protein ASCRUDRAFT_70970 [Ascoidea rubescens DSM 1968]ODV60467.1 hypothetical protein ASCRUDRAFT_70970 [Ascoidea rubescens DSM 1968]
MTAKSDIGSQRKRKCIYEMPDFYCCYVLRSEVSLKKFYIGSTPNPDRRVRQHNGELQQGGAFRTKQNRPWKMVILVYGFPSRISALKFEHSLQHPFQTRHISKEFKFHQSKQEYDKSRSIGNINQILINIKSLLISKFFKKFTLKFQIFDNEIFQLINDNTRLIKMNPNYKKKTIDISRENQDSLIEIFENSEFAIKNDHTDIKEFYQMEKNISVELLKICQLKLALVDGNDDGNNCGNEQDIRKINCLICSKEVETNYLKENFKLFFLCYNRDCSFTCHLRCLALQLLKKDTNRPLMAVVPTMRNCPTCGEELQWQTAAGLSTKLRAAQAAKAAEAALEEAPEEEADLLLEVTDALDADAESNRGNP